ncbi:hypothetical protein Poli38472_005120 [Pythium oligandrum]|uniref:Diacylglycerol kinase n=1 Tax=Pythium oligandrum TaxID=41045 RepID=A0A8K1CI23_PYTOL|nr:hypothetical protein Poli38472_005120 [Pythium oligandrum]|eukprot:TMW62502.1 hypothetical protein Poli38472_005120 [Pythium oligandrum]
MDSASDGLLDPTSSFVPVEAVEMFQRIGSMVVGLATALFCFLFVRRLVFYLTWRSFRDGPYVLGFHQWRPGNLAGPHWCNICESIVYGIRSYVVTCDICGMFAHAQCAATTTKQRAGVDDTCACKVAAVSVHKAAEPQQHLWVKGNIDPMDTCSICGLFCGSILALSGLKCAWCHIRVHENCFKSHSKPHHKHHLLQHCDLGRHANLIIPPTTVIVKESTPTYSSKSQRALSSVRSAAQIAVNKMSNIRLRRPGSFSPADTQGLKESSATTRSSSSTPCPSPSQSSSNEPLLDPPLLSLSSSVSTDSTSGLEPLIPVVAVSSMLPTPPSSSSTAETLPFDVIPSKDITPLLVFINSRSGGQLGLHVLRQIRRWLNPIQIYDLSHQSPIAPLRQFKDIPRLRILVCGGDGTVGWVLGALDEIGASRQPPIAVLPLGTGNDLARVLGWGSGFSTQDVSDILAEVEAAHVSLLDRWRVEINGKKRTMLNNYLGVGVDAQVALEFHEQRERSPGLFMSQFVNKLWYSQFGAKNFLVRTCAGLPSKMSLVCDGKEIYLPEGTEGVIILNINSYGGGSTLWHEESDSESDSDSDSEDDVVSASETEDGSMSDDGGLASFARVGPSSPHDGLLDVVAVYGTLHLGQMQVGLSKAVRLCQAKHVSIQLKETLPMQIDGEPWQQEPSEVDISFHQQAFMLSRTVQERDFVTRRVGEVLDWAENTGVISSTQRDVLLAEIARRVADGENQTTRATLLSNGNASGWHRREHSASLPLPTTSSSEI